MLNLELKKNFETKVSSGTSFSTFIKLAGSFDSLGFIYIGAKAKATSLPTSYVVSNVCVYTAATEISKKISLSRSLHYK